jgi:hypothetical protein
MHRIHSKYPLHIRSYILDVADCFFTLLSVACVGDVMLAASVAP